MIELENISKRIYPFIAIGFQDTGYCLEIYHTFKINVSSIKGMNHKQCFKNHGTNLYLGGNDLKGGAKCFMVLAVIFFAPFCVSASDKITKFQTGPFTGSLDLGMPCNDLNISKPAQIERISGESYTDYILNACEVQIRLRRFDVPVFNSLEHLGTANMKRHNIEGDLLINGADQDTINVFEREIDGKPGAVGSGYLSKDDKNLYEASFHIPPRTDVDIFLLDNESKMVSILKTIHVTEAE